jgi:phosphodiesterase/alkaline phosphatase D-like protein
MLAYTSLIAAAIMAVRTNAQAELPITTSDVFVQSGESTSTSVVIMSRCNTEKDSMAKVGYKARGSNIDTTRTVEAYEANDFTAKMMLTGLLSNTTYDYNVTCTANIDGKVTVSRPASFKTLPTATQETEISFVWAADLAGQVSVQVCHHVFVKCVSLLLTELVLCTRKGMGQKSQLEHYYCWWESKSHIFYFSHVITRSKLHVAHI